MCFLIFEEIEEEVWLLFKFLNVFLAGWLQF